MNRGIHRLALLVAAVIAVAGCGGTHESPSGAPQGSAGASVAGTPVSGEVVFAQETMEQSRALGALAEEGIGAPGIIRFLRPQVAARPLDGPGAPALPGWSQRFTAFPGPGSPVAPTLSASFAGLMDAGQFIPPDTMGTAGSTHLLETLNDNVAVFAKTGGAPLSNMSIDTFWGSVRLGRKAFDPRCLFDHTSGRFVAISIAGTSSSTTRLLIGVSLADDALGSWNKFGIVASSDGVTWADFDCLGVDDNNVYVSANMFNDVDAFQFVKIWVFPKAQLFAGSLTSWTEFINPAGASFTLQPAHTTAASAAQYFVHEGYLTGSPPTIRRFVRLSSVTFPSGTATWTDLGYIEVATYPISIPGAPQPGTTKLVDTNDTRLLNAVSHNGALWSTHTVANAAGTKTEVAWYKIDPAAANPFTSLAGIPLQQGRVSDASRFYYYPSIAVNASGDAALGFSGSSSTEYPGAYYTGRASSDPDNTMQSAGLLKAGTNLYTKDFGSGSIRWGDYSATGFDPADGSTFWTVQEYAAAPDDTWATWWGKFALSTPAVPNPPYGLSAVPVSATQVNLHWTDNSANEMRFLVERSLTAGSGFVQVGTAIANATTFNDSGLAPGATWFYRVRASNGAGASDNSNVASATTPTLPNPPTGLTATAVSASQINLAWADASSDETGFRIERKTAPAGTFAQVGTASANATSFSDGGLTTGTTYVYRVWALKAGAGDSATPSNEASATPSVPASGGGGGGGCSMAPDRQADPGSAAGALLALVAPLLILAGRGRRRA